MFGLALLITLVAACAVVVRWRRPRHPLPPGPKPWPIIGNALDMPSIRPWEKYREWCEQFNSDIVFLDLPTKPSILIGSVQAATELLEKRSQIHSDRIRNVMYELMDATYHFSFMRYTSTWRTHRRIFHQYFNPATISIYYPVQVQHARMFLTSILDSPQNVRKHTRQMITSVIFSIIYGKKITNMDDENVTIAQTAVEGISLAATPGVFWVEFLPALKYIPSWVPGTNSRRVAEKYLPFVAGMRDKPFNEVKAAVARGNAPPSVVASLVEENRTKYGKTAEAAEHDIIARNVAGVAYAAGADTTSSASQAFLLAMALYPDIQKKGQAELDKVVGPNRLPEFEDVEAIPYIRALVLELTRWMPITPFGVPHAASADDTYEGFHIPQGTMLIPNVWAMLKNPEDYPEPEEFKPERFIGQDGQIDPNVRDPTTIAFGFGRRICPGRHLALNTLAIYIASVLHSFNVSAGKDASGNPIELSTEMLGAMISSPRDVPCCIEPRSEAAVRLIQEAAAEH